MYTNSIASSFNLSQSQASILIEQLVHAIEYSKETAFRITTNAMGYEQVMPTKLSGRFSIIQQLIDVYTDHYDYSEHLQVFWRACQDIGLERSPAGPVCLNETGTRYLSFPQSMNALANRIRQLTSEPEYQRRANDRSYQARHNTAKLERYIRSVMDRHSRTEVIRVDLHYLTIVDPLLRIEHLYNDLSTLIRARERNPIFEHESGYVWSVEQGEDKGFHIHAAFFFNAAKVRSDWYKAEEIGALWQKITAGRGYIYNCNADKDKYEDELGIGRFKRSDTQNYTKIIKALSYLTKDEQHLRLKPAGARTFGTGQ